MSYVLFGDDVIFFQRLLKSEGLYKARVDGIWGPKTEKAAMQFHEKSEKIMDRLGYFDQRTEGHIFSLTLKTQQLAREFMNRVLDEGFDVKIISGTRTYEEQNRLFRIGRFGNPGKIVTKARGGRSNHNFGIAWDIGVFTAQDGYSTNADDYVEVAETGKAPDIEWGGDWTNFFDPSHYQANTGVDLATVRIRFENGEDLFA